jgi:NAD(P)-dependent dehydrogenase (short-subunit alcohol dehydrogenase family)
MDLGISGKVALVTGGASGIGAAIVRSLAEEGARVAFTSRDQDAGKGLVNELISRGHEIFYVPLSPVPDDGPSEVVKQVIAQLGNPSILVNNIGDTLSITDPMCSLQDWRSVYRLNLEVHIEMNNLVIPHMRADGWGRIVNITAGAALENSGPVPYSTMKSAYTAYTRSMARVLAPTGIVMSAVLPGVVLTEKGHWQNVLKTNPSHAKKYLEERTSLKRFGRPEEIAPFVTLLCSQLASFAVGAIVPVEGGQARHFFAGNLESYA